VLFRSLPLEEGFSGQSPSSSTESRGEMTNEIECRQILRLNDSNPVQRNLDYVHAIRATNVPFQVCTRAPRFSARRRHAARYWPQMLVSYQHFLRETSDCARSPLTLAFNYDLHLAGNGGKHSLLDRNSEQQILDRIRQNAETRMPVTRQVIRSRVYELISNSNRSGLGKLICFSFA
jgi:hypothetical protein